MALAFFLSMPNRSSWNGQWSGDGKCYAIVHNVGKAKAARDKAEKLAAEKSFYYNFGDGWGASVSVRVVDNNEARQIRRRSLGFCGYDWMVNSILAHGEILKSEPRRLVVESPDAGPSNREAL